MQQRRCGSRLACRTPGIHPARVAVDPKGIIWAADPYLNQFHLFDAEGAYLSSWGEIGAGPGQLGPSTSEKYAENQGPAVAFGPDGSMYLADMGNARVQKFDANLDYLFTFEMDPDLRYPMDIAIGPEGNLYVCDNDTQTIFVFDPDGTLLRSFGGYGTGDDRFILPVGLGVAPDGSVWVADFGTNSVKQFTPEGTLLAVHDRSGYPTGVMTSPNDVAFDSSGNVFVTESFGDRVSVLDMQGNPVGWWGNRGVDVTFGLPIGIAVAGDGTILIADISLQAVLAFTLDPLLAEPNLHPPSSG